jgi:hypothetical protein
MDRVKGRYVKQDVLNFFWEFADEFLDYCHIRKTQMAYEAVITWKLAGMVKYMQRNYEKHTSMAYQTINMPSYKCIGACLEQEKQNWIKYWNNVEKAKNGQTS